MFLEVFVLAQDEKVLRSVVRLVSVLMMHFFVGSKAAAEHLFCHPAMLSESSSAWDRHRGIATRIHSPTTLPVRVVWA